MLRRQLTDLERRFGEDVSRLEAPIDADVLDLTEVLIACRKTDLEIRRLMLVWTPWRVGADGIAEPAYDP